MLQQRQQHDGACGGIPLGIMPHQTLEYCGRHGGGNILGLRCHLLQGLGNVRPKVLPLHRLCKSNLTGNRTATWTRSADIVSPLSSERTWKCPSRDGRMATAWAIHARRRSVIFRTTCTAAMSMLPFRCIQVKALWLYHELTISLLPQTALSHAKIQKHFTVVRAHTAIHVLT